MSLYLKEDLSEEVKKSNLVNLENFQVLNNRIRNKCNWSKQVLITVKNKWRLQKELLKKHKYTDSALRI